MIAWATLMLAAAVQGQDVPDRIDIDHAEPGRFDRDALTDAELARQRGGFRLPNGIDVAMTVQTQSAVDGLVVLKTVFRADQGQPALTVLAPRPGQQVAAPLPATTTASSANSGPNVTYDSRNGIQISSGGGGPAVTLSAAGMAATPLAGTADGLTAIDVGPGGVATDAGVVSAATQGAIRSVELTAKDLSITHFAGSAFGSAIANSGSDRTIDTQTAVTIDLANAGPDVLGSALLRVDSIATDALASRMN